MSAARLLSPQARLLLRAISHSGEVSRQAFLEWRAMETLDLAHGESHRVLPLLLELARREGLDDPDLARMRGVARQVWTYNVLRLRLLFDAVDLLEAEGITPILMKGAALFARAPELERRRVSNDYDILISDDQLGRAARILRDHGFSPPGHAWEDVGPPLLDSVEAGFELRRGPQRGLDLHWRPLWNVRDPGLARLYWSSAETAELHGRPTHIPNATHQLFCAMARCEPWDRVECFTRVVEAFLLLSATDASIDWPTFVALTRQYGFECTALAFLETLRDDAGLLIPASVTDDLAAGADRDKQREWRIRSIPPVRRSEGDIGHVQRQDFAAGRSGRVIRPLQPIEERLRRLAPALPVQGTLWRLARQRLAEVPASDAPLFLEGVSSPEDLGRWTDGRWALLVIPLTPAQQQGEPLRLNAHAYRGGSGRRRIVATGGLGTVTGLLVDREVEADLDVRLLPLPELDGRGLLLLHLPDAAVPAEVGGSSDRRQLGLFVRRQWDRGAAGADGAATPRFLRLRRLWRHLPIPAPLRQRWAPELGRLARRLMFRRLPRPLPPATITPGNLVVSGFFSDVSGIGRAGRLTLEAVRHWPVAAEAHDLRRDPQGQTVAASAGGVWICHCNAPEAAHAMLSGTAHLWARRYRIGIWAYELERLPPDWVAVLTQFHEIWVPSAFVAAAVRASCSRAGPLVRVVPHPFPALPERLAAPRCFPQDRPFRFLAMFDMRSTVMRKNPMGAIRAFQSAFEPQARSVNLMIKVVEAGFDAAALAELRRATAGWPNISIMTEQLGDDGTLALIAEADCLVSLHRSEGFGLTIAEAMSVGTPAIITGWSAPVEFSAGAALAVPYRLVPADDPTGRYGRKGARWAEPDLDGAATAMRRLTTDSALWQELSNFGLARASDRRAEDWPHAPYRSYLSEQLS